MKKLQKLFAMTAVLSMMASPALYSQQACYDNASACYDNAHACCDNSHACCDNAPAYEDSCCASNMTALLPIGALVVAGVLIATTHRHHHHRCHTTTTTHAHATASTTCLFE